MEWEEEMAYPSYPPTYPQPPRDDDVDFDYLLREAQRKQRHSWWWLRCHVDCHFYLHLPSVCGLEMWSVACAVIYALTFFRLNNFIFDTL